MLGRHFVFFSPLGRGRHDREAQKSYHRPMWIPLWVQAPLFPSLIPTLKRPVSEGIALRTRGVFNLDSLRRRSSPWLAVAIKEGGSC